MDTRMKIVLICLLAPLSSYSMQDAMTPSKESIKLIVAGCVGGVCALTVKEIVSRAFAKKTEQELDVIKTNLTTIVTTDIAEQIEKLKNHQQFEKKPLEADTNIEAKDVLTNSDIASIHNKITALETSLESMNKRIDDTIINVKQDALVNLRAIEEVRNNQRDLMLIINKAITKASEKKVNKK